MLILSLNSGSSSLKFAVFRCDQGEICFRLDRRGVDHRPALRLHIENEPSMNNPKDSATMRRNGLATHLALRKRR